MREKEINNIIFGAIWTYAHKDILATSPMEKSLLLKSFFLVIISSYAPIHGEPKFNGLGMLE